jgi:hypothetical protein
MSIISTPQLLETVSSNKKKFVEARLLLNGGYATHFLIFNGRHLYDEGIDGEKRKTNFSDFSHLYFNCFWIIDQIV